MGCLRLHSDDKHPGNSYARFEYEQVHDPKLSFAAGAVLCFMFGAILLLWWMTPEMMK